MRAKDIMIIDVVTVTPETSVEEIAGVRAVNDHLGSLPPAMREI